MCLVHSHRANQLHNLLDFQMHYLRQNHLVSLPGNLLIALRDCLQINQRNSQLGCLQVSHQGHQLHTHRNNQLVSPQLNQRFNLIVVHHLNRL